MDSRGHIHMLDDHESLAELAAGRLKQVPIEIQQAATEAWLKKEPLINSSNRRAAAWARHNAKLLLQDSKKRQRKRKANKAARVARRARRA